MKHWLLIVLMLLFVALSVSAQEPPAKKRPHLVRGKVVEGDTVATVQLREVSVYAKDKRKYQRNRAKYDRLVYNIKKTLPYARVAGKRMQEVNDHLATLKTEKERKAYLKQAEKKLFEEFEGPLRKLTFSQGRLLIKLIDRETGNTSFNLVKEYRGGVSAFFWQSVARVFGANLKDDYEAEGDDKTIEYIIQQIDAGLL
jgi:hypothetical protein